MLLFCYLQNAVIVLLFTKCLRRPCDKDSGVHWKWRQFFFSEKDPMAAESAIEFHE